MSAVARLRLVVGMVLVLCVAAGATYHLNQTRGRVDSTSAQILGREVVVGAPYGGVVLTRSVDVGTAVHQGDALFVLDAPALALAIAGGRKDVPATTKVDAQGHLVVEAAADGTVTSVTAEPGSSVQAGAELARVQRTNSLYVEAQFTLTPKEYARVPANAPVQVRLPDGTSVTGTAQDLHTTTVNGTARTVATVTSPQLSGGGGLITAGAPVVAELQLRNDGWVTRVSDQVRALVVRWLP
jgi:multidrug resistance efflux pump